MRINQWLSKLSTRETNDEGPDEVRLKYRKKTTSGAGQLPRYGLKETHDVGLDAGLLQCDR